MSLPHSLRRSAVWLAVLTSPLQASATSVEPPLGGLKWSWTLTTPPLHRSLSQAATTWPQLLQWAQSGAASNRAADAGAQAAVAAKDQAWASAWMPRLDASGSTSRDRQQVNSNPTIRTPSTSLTLTATMPVWRAGDRAAAQSQSAVAEQAAWQARNTQTQVAQDTSSAYLGLVEAAEQQRLLRAQADLLDEQWRINERRLQAGAGTVLETLETRTRIDQAKAAVQEQVSRVRSLQLTLSRLTGHALHAPAGLQRLDGLLPDVVPPLDEALSLVAHRNPQILQAMAQVQASQAAVQARQADSWQPTLDAYASTSRLKQVPKLDGFSQSDTTRSTSVGLQMNWALFSGGAQQGRVKEASALLTQAQAQLDDAQSQVMTRLQDAYQSLTQARAILASQRQVEQTAVATHEAVRKAFVAGIRTNLDLLNAQQQIFVARQNMVSATVTGLNAQVTILALLDQLDAEHVSPLTPMFDLSPLEVSTAP